MSTKKKVIYVLVAITLILGVGVVLGLHGTTPNKTVSDNKEPESEGLSLVRFNGDAKFNTLLATPQLRAAKKELSTYIHTRYGQKTYTAIIEKTTLQNNGDVDLTIRAGDHEPFEAVIRSEREELIISVPPSNYQKSVRQETVLRQYGVY